MFAFLKALFGFGVAQQPNISRPTNSVMDEGDYHSGPHGYSPNTPYQETQYGSRFDEEADWNHEG